MDADLLTLAQVYRLLGDACRKAGSQAAFAEQAGVTPAFVSAVLNAKKAPTPRLLAGLGLVQVTRFMQAKPKTVNQSVNKQEGAANAA